MKKIPSVILAFALLALPALCSAAPPHSPGYEGDYRQPPLIYPEPPRPRGYASAFLGFQVATDTDVTSTDFITGRTFNDRVEFDPGINVGGTAGYDFGIFRMEGELSYKHSEIHSITDQSNGFQFHSVDGNLGALAMMFNTFIDLHNPTPITPYFGGGIGFALLHLSDTFAVDAQGGAPQQLLLYPSDDATVFAYQAGAGLEIAINRLLSLDLGYRYFGTAKARFDSNFDTSTSLQFESHNAVVGVRFKF